MPDNEKFLSDIRSNDKEVRFAAWRSAAAADPRTIPQLGRLAASTDPGVAKAAREAITTLVHAVGPSTSDPRRAAVVSKVLELAAPAYELPVRAFAFRQLSLVAGDDAVPAIAKWIRDTDLREEVVYCLERIPGSASAKALLASYRDARDDFKPRMLAALGHRRIEEAVPLCLEAMRSQDKEIAAAAAKAFGRIGRKPASNPKFPEDAFDSQLRYADALVKSGHTADALKIYQPLLERPEEHLQCAAIVGIGKIGTAAAAGLVYPKLESPNSKVRLTARKVWIAQAERA